MLEKKRLHRFIKPQLLDFQNFQPGKLLRLWPKSQPQPLATRLQHVLFVFSRSKWSMKIQRGNECIMLFKWEWCYLLLLDTKENANLLRVDVAISTLINYFRKLFEFFRGYLQTCICWNNHSKVFLEESCPKNVVSKKGRRVVSW